MGKVIARALIALLRIYQVTLSPLLGERCRFYPSCSRYMVKAIEKKGPSRGLRMGLVRILKCHPFHPGGYDPVE